MKDVVRRAMGDRLRAIVGSGAQDLSRTADDHGLFGPASVAGIVHGDFTAMMVGGIASLLLQMLHPPRWRGCGTIRTSAATGTDGCGARRSSLP